MVYTLLELVQDILSSMDSDEVNSINDTVESYQVALLLKSVYYDLATELRLPEHDTQFQLNASGDSAKPVLMTVPSGITRVKSVKYDSRLVDEDHANYLDIPFRPFDEFLTAQQGLRFDTTDVGEMTYTMNGSDDEFTMMYRTDRAPTYFTTLDDNTYLFDAYDSAVDTTLQKTKTACYGSKYKPFLLEDTFTPVIDPTQFAYYRNRAKTRAFFELKQQENPDSAKETRNQKIVVQRLSRKTPDVREVYKVARYGRK